MNQRDARVPFRSDPSDNPALTGGVVVMLLSVLAASFGMRIPSIRIALRYAPQEQARVRPKPRFHRRGFLFTLVGPLCLGLT